MRQKGDSRRAVLRKGAMAGASLLGGATIGGGGLRAQSATAGPAKVSGKEVLGQEILGQGEFRYRVVPDWGVLDEKTPVKNCHGLAIDREGHILLLTDHTANNVIVYDAKGRLVAKWGTEYPGAHGLSLVNEGRRQVLYLTDLQRHLVVKTTLDGQVLQQWGWPSSTGKYAKEADYRPSWTLHGKDGSFYVLDGYGKDYILAYNAKGEFTGIFGGAEGGIVHWGPHGGMWQQSGRQAPTLLLAMSDQQYLLRVSLTGEKLQQVDLPGGNPRQIRPYGKHLVVAHLADNWPKDRNSRGFLSVLDEQMRVVSNIGGTPPRYDDRGQLQPMQHQEELFQHPHDVAVGRDGALYVAQFASGNTYPLKLERV